MVVDGIKNPKIQHVIGNHSGRIIEDTDDTPSSWFLYPDDDKDCDIGGSFVIRFGFDGDKIELLFQGYSHLRLYVDEGNGYERRYSNIVMKKYERKNKVCALFDFGSAKQRNIMLELELRCPFGGFIHNKTYTIYPTSDRQPLAMYIGSSLTAGGMQQYNCWNYLVSKRLGMDWINCGEGSTGFANDAGGLDGKKKVWDRLKTDVFPKKPWLLTLEGSYNDMGGGLQVDKYITDFLRPTFADVVEQLPNCLSIVVGTFATCRDLKVMTYDWDDKNNALRQVALEYNLPFIDTLNGKVYDSLGNLIVNGTPWFTGTGYDGNAQGDGNSDIYIKNDKTHFNSDGDLYVAGRMLESIMAIIYAEKKVGRIAEVNPVFNIKKSDIILNVNNTATIEYYPTDANAILTSSNENIVSVNGNIITAMSNGAAMLTATYNGVVDTCLVNVIGEEETPSSANLTSISATKTKTSYNIGDAIDTSDVTVTAYYDDETNKTVYNWTSNEDSIDMNSEGTKDLIISYTNNDITKTYTIKITITATQSTTAVEPISVVDDYTVKGDGSMVAKSTGGRLYVYSVIPGNTYHLTSSNKNGTVTYAFNDNGSTNVLTELSGGQNYSWVLVDTDITIPEGMTYLYVGESTTGITITVTTNAVDQDDNSEITRPVVPQTGTWQLKTTTDKKYIMFGTDDDNEGNPKFFRMLRTYGFPYVMNTEGESTASKKNLGSDIDETIFTDSDAQALFPNGVNVIELGKYLHDNNLGEVAQHGSSDKVLWDSEKLTGDVLTNLHASYTSQGGTKSEEELKAAIMEQLASSDGSQGAQYIEDMRTQLEQDLGFFINTVGCWGGVPTATIDGIKIEMNAIKGSRNYNWREHNYSAVSPNVGCFVNNKSTYDLSRITDGVANVTSYIDRMLPGGACEFFWHMPFHDETDISTWRKMFSDVKSLVDGGEIEVITREKYASLGEYVENPITKIILTRDNIKVGESDIESAYVVTATYSDGTSADVSEEAIVDYSEVKADTTGQYNVTATYRGFNTSCIVSVIDTSYTIPEGLKDVQSWFIANNNTQGIMLAANTTGTFGEAINSGGSLTFQNCSSGKFNGWVSNDNGSTWNQVNTNCTHYKTIKTNAAQDSGNTSALCFGHALNDSITFLETSENFTISYSA